MTTTRVSRLIQAPIESVFETVAHIENFERVAPDIIRIEFLSENKTGVGARFRETRRMGKREASTELEVTEYVPNERIRIVADQGGTIWDSVFTVEARPSGEVELVMVMEARAYRFLAKIMNPLIKGMIRKAIEKDLEAVKAHCES